MRVAEILKLDDLIRSKTTVTRRWTPRACCSRRPISETIGLARGYLAHRLGVAPDQVVMPSTPVVGWRELPYYDPPAKKSGKPKLVGRHPCIVFGTIAQDGRKHAHRIYVADGGAGKADLGVGPDGHPRDPKKSARLEPGRALLAAPCSGAIRRRRRTCCVAEGIETAAALAHAHRAEIEVRRDRCRCGPLDQRHQSFHALAGDP